MERNPDLLFEEEQQFRQPWLLALLGGMTALFGYGAIRQFGFDEPWGSRPMSNRGMAATGGLMVALDALLLSIRLITQVRRDGLYLRYFPLHPRFHRIPLEGVTRCRAVTYRPLPEYGGWGIRYGRGGKAYNVSGNRGVRLDYADGHHLLIGSQRAEELARALAPFIEKTA